MQATVASFSPQTRSGTVLLDDGTELPFSAEAFATSGMRMFRLGQRVKLKVVHGRVIALTHIALPLP